MRARVRRAVACPAKVMKTRIASWLTAVTLLEWGGIFLYFYVGGRLQAFLHPSFRPLVLLTGLMLSVGGLLAALASIRGAHMGRAAVVCAPDDAANFRDADGGRDARWAAAARALAFAVLIVPLPLAAAISSDGYSAASIRNRAAAALPAVSAPTAAGAGRVLPSGAPAAPAAGTVPDGPPAGQAARTTAAAAGPGGGQTQYLKTDARGRVKAELVDFMYAAQSPELRRDFDGKEVEVIGQFLQVPGAGGAHAILTRLFMICCAADAQPINIPMQARDAAVPMTGLSELAWVRVVGTVRFDHAEQVVAQPFLTVQEIQPIPAPKEKYLY